MPLRSGPRSSFSICLAISSSSGQRLFAAADDFARRAQLAGDAMHATRACGAEPSRRSSSSPWRAMSSSTPVARACRGVGGARRRARRHRASDERAGRASAASSRTSQHDVGRAFATVGGRGRRERVDEAGERAEQLRQHGFAQRRAVLGVRALAVDDEHAAPAERGAIRRGTRAAARAPARRSCRADRASPRRGPCRRAARRSARARRRARARRSAGRRPRRSASTSGGSSTTRTGDGGGGGTTTRSRSRLSSGLTPPSPRETAPGPRGQHRDASRAYPSFWTCPSSSRLCTRAVDGIRQETLLIGNVDAALIAAFAAASACEPSALAGHVRRSDVVVSPRRVLLHGVRARSVVPDLCRRPRHPRRRPHEVRRRPPRAAHRHRPVLGRGLHAPDRSARAARSRTSTRRPRATRCGVSTRGSRSRSAARTFRCRAWKVERLRHARRSTCSSRSATRTAGSRSGCTAAASRTASRRRSCSASAACACSQALGESIDVYHFNEGHAVFAGLELLRQHTFGGSDARRAAGAAAPARRVHDPHAGPRRQRGPRPRR